MRLPLALLTLAWSLVACGCDPRLADSGVYACQPGDPDGCPPGWYCQMRAERPGEHRCYAEPGAFCGDGKRDPGEACDVKEAFASDSCLEVGFKRGELRCDDTCSEILTDACSGGCGDGAVDPGEECDGDALGGWDCRVAGFYEGTLKCASCRRDTSGCARRCGDGLRDPEEQCDGADLDGATCGSLGYHDGPLGCTAACRFDVSGCDGFCGDGLLNGDEECDGDESLGGKSCEDLPSPGTGPYHPGTLRCLPSCTFAVAGCGGYCGDGRLDPGEACDGFDFGGRTCWDTASPGVGAYHGGALACSADCRTVLTTGCTGYCGDGVRNGAEACDGADLGGSSCVGFGYHEGTPVCLETCDGFKKGCPGHCGCSGYCGDGVVNGGEFCDGRDQLGESCASYSRYAGGALGCDAQCRRTFATCAQEWSPASAGTAETLRAAWGSAAGDVFVVGGSVILHWDGGAWSTQPSAPGVALYAVWGSSPSDVWAVGSGVLHYDGTGWTPVASPPGLLNGVWGSAPDDVFAVGAGGLILHYDGQQWQAMTSGHSGPLSAVWGSSGDDVFAAGGSGTILHYDGTEWSPMDVDVGTPVAPWFNAVWGTSAGNVFAAGSVFASGAEDVVAHYDGSAWSAMALPPGASVRALWGSSARDLFAAGAGGRLYHHDGAAWSPMASGTSVNLNGLGGTSADDVFAVGDGGTVLRHVGDTWRSVAVGPSALGGFHDVWAGPAGDVWVGGDSDTAVVHFDGADWSPMTIPGTSRCRDLWGTPGGQLFCTGSSAVWHYDGAAWSSMAGSAFVNCDDLWGRSPTELWAACGYAVFRYDGASWGQAYRPGGAGQSMRAVWAAPTGEVFAAGSGQEVYRYEGGAWTAQPSGTTGITGLWGTAAGDVIATDYAGNVLHYDGTEWSLMSSGNTEPLAAVAGRSSSDVFAVGERGTVLHFDGASWSPMATRTTEPLEGVAAAGDVYVAGASKTLLRLHSLPTLDGGACAAPIPLYCSLAPEDYHGSNALGRTPALGLDGCDGGRVTTGPEVFYRLESPITGTVRLRLAPHRADLDLGVLGANADGTCSPASCLVADPQAGTLAETVELQATQGAVYYVVIDGYAGATSGYTLTIECARD